MRTVTTTFTVYKYETAPSEVQERIREYIINSWNIYEHCLQERIETLKAFADYLQCDLRYSISCVPDRGEHITFIPKNYNSIEENLSGLLELKDCPFTGVYYDDELLELVRKNIPNSVEPINGVNNALVDYLKSIHSEYESMCEHDYIKDLCESNDYEFLESGELY